MATSGRLATWITDLVAQIERGDVGVAFQRVGLAALPLVALIALVIILVVYTLSDASTRTDDDDEDGGGGGSSGRVAAPARRPGGVKQA